MITVRTEPAFRATVENRPLVCYIYNLPGQFPCHKICGLRLFVQPKILFVVLSSIFIKKKFALLLFFLHSQKLIRAFLSLFRL